jgi:RNA polymerase sigma factor (sigma-70 family)
MAAGPMQLGLMPLDALTALVSSITSARLQGDAITDDAEALVIRLFHEEGRSLVRLARLFVDDRNAAEDLVQEAFLRLARHAHRIDDVDKAPAYLRSIVLNLARDHNRRGLVSLRHHATAALDDPVGGRVGARGWTAESPDEELVRSDEHRRVLVAVRDLPIRQRDCVTLRYFAELGIEAIAGTLGLSRNSVKTHLQRGLANLERSLAERVDDPREESFEA